VYSRPSRRFVRHVRIGPASAGAQRGQSLVEFALVLPVLLLIVLAGLDVGRAFLGWVGLNSAARVGADFAARNPTAWDVSNPNLTLQAEYTTLITNETKNIGCVVATPEPPTFPALNTEIGSPAHVGLTCQFSIITPLIGAVLPNPLPISAGASFPIRAGSIAGIPVATAAPYPTAAPTPTPAPTPAPTATPDPGGTPAPTATPTAEPTAAPSPTPPMCTVPTLTGFMTNQVQQKWHNNAGFLTNVIFNPLAGGNSNYRVNYQSIPAGQSRDCATTTIEVRPLAPTAAP